MKYLIACVAFLINVVASGQDNLFSMRAGYSVPFAPYGVWSEGISSAYENNDFTFYPGDGYGLTFDTEIPSKFPFMSYRIGAFYNYSGRYDLYEGSSQTSEVWMYLTGFGLYSGVSFKAGWEHIGLLSTFAVGYYTFDYRAEMQYTTSQGGASDIDYIGESVSGPGGKFELGLYGTIKGINIYPSFQFINCANGSQTLLIKSFNLSLGYTFR